MTAPWGNLDDLMAQVRRRTEQRALALEAEAEVQARRIAEEGDAHARAAAAALLDGGRRRADDAHRGVRAAADLERRRRRLTAREARLERVWADARGELERLDAAPAGRAALARLARDAAARLGGAEVAVQVDARTHAGLGPDEVAAWAGPDGPRFRLHPEPLAQGHGVVVHADRASVDATYEGRLAQARERLRSEIDALLGGAP
jgi:vacuolar-type H+-ATPase subunit E/Vma4